MVRCAGASWRPADRKQHRLRVADLRAPCMIRSTKAGSKERSDTCAVRPISNRARLGLGSTSECRFDFSWDWGGAIAFGDRVVARRGWYGTTASRWKVSPTLMCPDSWNVAEAITPGTWSARRKRSCGRSVSRRRGVRVATRRWRLPGTTAAEIQTCWELPTFGDTPCHDRGPGAGLRGIGRWTHEQESRAGRQRSWG